MKTTEVNKKIIGRRCRCIFTGLLVTGVIEDTTEDKYTVSVKVRFDTPHQWVMNFILMTGLSDGKQMISAH